MIFGYQYHLNKASNKIINIVQLITIGEGLMKNKTAVFSINNSLILISLITIIMMAFVERGYQVFNLVAFIIFISVALISKRHQALFLIMFLSPINRVFLLENINYTIIPILIAIFVIKSFLISKSIDRRFLISVFLLMTINFASSYLAVTNIINTLYFFLYLFFSFYISRMKNRELFIDASKFYISGSLISSILGMYFTNISNSVQNFRYIEYQSYRYMGLLHDPTEFGQKIIVALAFSILIIIISSSMIEKISYTLFSVVFIQSLILSGTRSVLFGIIILVLFAIYKVLKAREIKKITKTMIFTSVPIILLLVYSLVISNLMDLRSGTQEVLFTDRFNIWSGYYQLFSENIIIFLIGIGAGNILTFSRSIGRITLHNGFFEILFEFGLIGSILFMYSVNRIVNRYSKFDNKSSYLPLICYLTTLFSLGITRSEMFFILIGLSGFTVIEKRNSM